MIAPSEQIAGRNVTLGQIETKCEKYETSSAFLEQLISDLETDLETVKKKHLARIKKQAGDVANIEAELHSLIESAPGLFTSPRTLTVHGVKVGFSLSSGRLVFDDEETVVTLIKKFHKLDADTYIRKSESVNKDALRTLNAEQLRQLGCKIEGEGDTVILKRVAGEVEKLINKLITKLVEAMVEND